MTEVFHRSLQANSEVAELVIKLATTASLNFFPNLLFSNYQSPFPHYFQLLSRLLDHRIALPGKVYTFVHSTNK